MLIAHMADVHLGASKYGIEELRKDILEAFVLALDEVRKERPDVLVVAGDLFDSPHPDNAVVKFAVRRLRGLASSGVKVVAAHGEHDTPGGRDASVLSLISAAIDNFVAPEPPADAKGSPDAMSITIDKAKFFVYPFVRASRDYRRKMAAELMPLYARRVEEARRGGLKAVFVAHASFTPVFAFDAVADLSDLPPADYVALGHVHLRCVNCRGSYRPKAYAYPGSLYPLSIEEVRQQAAGNFARGPLLVDLSGDEPSIQEVRVEVRKHVVAQAVVDDPTKTGEVISEAVARAVSGVRGEAPVIHLEVWAPPSVPYGLVLDSASRAGQGAIVVPHVYRLPARRGQGRGKAEGGGPGAAEEAEVTPFAVLKELGADEHTSRIIAELLSRKDVDDELVEKVIDELAGDESSLAFLRSLSQKGTASAAR